MPNIAKVLKEEICRLSRKEMRSATAGLAKSNATLRRTAATLRKEVAVLKAGQKRLSSSLAKLARNAGVESPKDEFRMTSRGVRALRRKLKLTQAQLAALLGVSAQTVFLWESKGGRLEFRGGSEAALRDVRSIDASEAAERLAKKSRRHERGRSARNGPGDQSRFSLLPGVPVSDADARLWRPGSLSAGPARLLYLPGHGKGCRRAPL